MHRDNVRLSQEAAGEKSERIDIANTAARLVELWKGREQFDREVKNAEPAWERVENDAKMELASPKQVSVPWGLYNTTREWQSQLAQALGTARRLLGQMDMNGMNGQTDHFDPAASVPGDENMPNEWNRLMWRRAFDHHQKAQKFIDIVRGRINSEIEQLTKKVTDSAQPTATH